MLCLYPFRQALEQGATEKARLQAELALRHEEGEVLRRQLADAQAPSTKYKVLRHQLADAQVLSAKRLVLPGTFVRY